ncbi:MAG: cob(I)yrinic acid a,c-diamide adenosyltransferase [Candidatus Dadabacteria bacterium]|nr:MAG: cob(I)yrinic acid a,c-diamide adenosyltransferase [Candidatus Dadabacteria bacterium]
MKIYTKQGDKGETRLFGGRKVLKSDLQVSAYGEVDELNSWIGAVRALLRSKEELFKKAYDIDEVLTRIQKDLFSIGNILAQSSEEEIAKEGDKVINVGFIEDTIDSYSAKLSSLRSFILPGGSLLSSYFHICRTVCRRAERAVVRLNQEREVSKEVLAYINRLSDLFFIFARYINSVLGIAETKWP